MSKIAKKYYCVISTIAVTLNALGVMYGHIGPVKKDKLLVNEPLDLDHLNPDEWFDVHSSSPPISSLLILPPIRLDREFAKLPNVSYFLPFGAVIGPFSTGVLSSLWMMGSALSDWPITCHLALYNASSSH